MMMVVVMVVMVVFGKRLLGIPADRQGGQGGEEA
jgi:hypothetical protein